MEQSGEYRIAASRETVWSALNDPDVLCRCLDGCESMERLDDDRFTARIKAKVGPVRATFDAELELENVVPPESYTISAHVKGGPAGFARGAADVWLSGASEETLLRYAIRASVGGKLAQVGSRLIDGAARKMADDFFASFAREMEGGEAVEAERRPAGTEAPRQGAAEATGGGAEQHGPRRYESGGRWVMWVLAFVALLLAMLFAL